MSETITSLIEKLEQAESGSRELDATIADLLLDPIFKPLSKTRQMRWPFAEGSGIAALTPPVTTSLDAALALAERMLPGARVMVERFHDGKGWAMAQRASESAKIMTDGNTPALALCAAVLRAQSEARV